MDQTWFANRGQIVQVILTAGGFAFAVYKGVPDLMNNQYFSAGSFLLYILVAAVVWSFYNLAREWRRLTSERSARSDTPASPLEPLTTLDVYPERSTDPKVVYKLKL